MREKYSARHIIVGYHPEKKKKNPESENERKGYLDVVPDTLVFADNGELIPSSILDNISTPVNYVVSFTRKFYEDNFISHTYIQEK